MKKQLVTLLCMLAANFSFSQQGALTEKGEEVILFDDGTWEYKYPESIEIKEIPTNPKNFTKAQDASFLLKSSRWDVGFWLNPKKWTFKKAVNNIDAEYEVQFKEGDLYGMIITEKFEIPLETLKMVAVENGKAFAPDLKVVKEEYRIVNGLKVLMLQMNGTGQGIKFSYVGYYFSCEGGTVQFVTYTSQNLVNTYLPEIESVLNGIVTLL